ncbi:hypothetical protein KKB18_05055, partial [bacterium]|nr:hypothetical protein [bacterium]
MTFPNSINRKIKVCHIITKLELGGAQEVTLDTLRLLDTDQFEKHLITNNEGLLIPRAKKIPNIDIHFIPELIREINPYKDLRAYMKLKKLLEEISPDIVHT